MSEDIWNMPLARDLLRWLFFAAIFTMAMLAFFSNKGKYPRRWKYFWMFLAVLQWCLALTFDNAFAYKLYATLLTAGIVGLGIFSLRKSKSESDVAHE